MLAAGVAHALGDRPPKKYELVGNAKVCSDRAWSKIKAAGRTYSVDRRGYDEKTGLQNFWIGDHLFILPKGYMGQIGFGYASDAPGISALFDLALPDMTPQVKPGFKSIGDVGPYSIVRISCDIRALVTVAWSSKTTKVGLLNLYIPSNKKYIERSLPELGLLGYSDEGGSHVVYFPANEKIRNPHGGALGINCMRAYPPKPESSDARCSIRYVLRDGISVDLGFPLQYLMYWQKSYESLLDLLNSSLQVK